MTLDQLIAQLRSDAEDAIAPYLHSNAAITGWLNEAQEEACTRALLIQDWSTPDVCVIAVTAGTSTYPAHASIINITRAAFTPTGSDEETTLDQTEAPDLDRARPGWRAQIDEPRDFVHTDTHIRLGCVPEASGVLALEVNRLPLTPMAITTDAPEIAARHHRHLVHWALHRAYSKPDSETLDPNRAGQELTAFTKMFGLRPDATIQRAAETSQPHRTKTIWLG
jgi:hypothetical protein